MSIYQALYASVNGINANGAVTALIGDNISNVNTTGFKSTRAEFSDIVAGDTKLSGLGARVSGTRTYFSQGGFEATTSVTDLAIDGEGFFQVNDFINQRMLYTRAGQYNINEDGYLVTQEGYRLRGFDVTADNSTITAEQVDFQFTFEPVPPRATTTIDISSNLISSATTPAAFDVTDPVLTSNYSAGISVFDSLGQSHLVTMYFRNNGAVAGPPAGEQWEYFAVCDADDITGATVAQIEANGTLLFNSNGALVSVASTTNDFDFVDATQSQVIDFDFGTNTTTGSGMDGMTSFGTASTLNRISQDGYSPGVLSTIEIGTDGVIVGNYTNATRLTLGQVGVALFADNQGLRRVGGNGFAETLTSGVPLFSAPQTGGRGQLLSATLEQSNVDLANELIKLVVIQRGFQANTRTISVVNELLGSLVSLGG